MSIPAALTYNPANIDLAVAYVRDWFARCEEPATVGILGVREDLGTPEAPALIVDCVAGGRPVAFAVWVQFGELYGEW